MLRIKIYIKLFFLFTILINQNINSAEIKILFKVNNEIITSQDILDELRYLRGINKEFKKTNNNQAFEISKNSLIREIVKQIEIKKNTKKIKIDNKILNNVILDYFKYLEIQSIPEFEKYFLNLGLIPDDIRKKVTLEIMWNQLIFNKFNKNVKINEKLIREILSKKGKQKEFLISEILFNVNENEKFDKKLRLILRNIEKKNFSQAAIKYSVSNSANKGGEIGWIKEASLNKKISDKLNKLKINEFTKPIVVPGGFLILKVKDVRETSKNYNLDDEVNKIIIKKTNQQLNQFSNIYFNKVKKDIQINAL